jgi:hypothetical protein
MPEKYQEEIEEILEGLGEKAPANTAAREPQKPLDDTPVVSHRGSPPRQSGPNQGRTWPTVTPGKLALIGLVVLLVGALWVRPLIWVGLGFLVGAYILFFIKPRSIFHEKRWRGKPMEEETSPWEKIKSWLKS